MSIDDLWVHRTPTRGVATGTLNGADLKGWTLLPFSQDKPAHTCERCYQQSRGEPQEGEVRRRGGCGLRGRHVGGWVGTRDDEMGLPTDGDGVDNTSTRDIEHVHLTSAECYKAELPIIGDSYRLR